MIAEATDISTLLAIDIEDDAQIIFHDRFSEYGILPFHLVKMYKRLVYDFKSGDQSSIVRTATDMGHYIGDAHVPLHTTENYNGQMTDQIGIHGFWESRLPELFAISEYDFFVGQADYIEDKPAYFWNIILESHALLDSVLQVEYKTRMDMPQDLITCFEDRLQRNVQVQCREFSRAYHTRLKGMVEAQMTSSILSLGDVWYSAWVDAGKPNLENIMEAKIELSKEEKENQEKLDELKRQGEIKGRRHGD